LLPDPNFKTSDHLHDPLKLFNDILVKPLLVFVRSKFSGPHSLNIHYKWHSTRQEKSSST